MIADRCHAAFRAAATIAGTSGVLAVVLGLAMRPSIPHTYWDMHSTLVFIGWVWAATFGAGLSGTGTTSGVSAHLGAGMPPLTITLLALGAGAVVFRRSLVRSGGVADSATTAVLTAVGAAVMTALPPTIAAALLHLDSGATLHLVGLSGHRVLDAAEIRVGYSAVQTFALTFVLTLIVNTLAAIVVSRSRSGADTA